MRRQQLRPLSVTETLDAVFNIYRSNFVKLITITAVVTVPVLLVQGLVQISLLNQVTSGDNLGVGIFGSLFASIVVGILSFLATMFATGAVVRAVADTYLGSETDWQASLRAARPHLAALAIGAFLFGLGVSVGLVLVIVPGVILGIGWSVFAPAIIIENRSATNGLSRSWNLTAGRRMPTFGVFALLYIALFVVAAIFGMVLGFLSFTSGDVAQVTVSSVLIDGIVSVLTTPLLAVAAVVVYFDLRVRKEGYDVELLANQIGEALPEGYAPPPQSDRLSPPEEFGDPGSAWPPPSDH